MEVKRFSTGEAIRFGWQKVKDNLGFYMLVMLVYTIIELTPNTIEKLLKHGYIAISESAAAFLIRFIHGVAFAVELIISIGFIVIALKIHDGKPSSIYDLFRTTSLFFKYLFASFLYGLIVAGGPVILAIIATVWYKSFTAPNDLLGVVNIVLFLAAAVLFIIFGIIWAVKFGLFPYLVVDRALGPIHALEGSAIITEGNKKNILTFWLCLAGLNMLGFFALCVGLFVTIPVSMVASAYVYRKLSEDNPKQDDQ